jgi:hypothetical protein
MPSLLDHVCREISFSLTIACVRASGLSSYIGSKLKVSPALLNSLKNEGVVKIE